MADLEEMTPGQVLADTSVADFIRELGLGIAAAQAALDDNSVRQMEVFTTRRDDLGGRSLLDLGLMPSFYHYQHADISTSMQIRMEVGRSNEFGFGVRAGITDNQSSTGSSNTSSTSTTTTEERRSKTARLSMRADSTGVLAIQGGATLTPTGDTPTQRLQDLQRQLTSAAGEIQRVVFRPPDTRPDMSLNSPTDKVVVQSPTVAFLRPDTSSALIRIRENVDTDFVVNTADPLTVNTTAQASLADYAAHVSQAFRDAGFSGVIQRDPGPRAQIGVAYYDTDVQTLDDEATQSLMRLAEGLKATNQRVEIEGFTDRQGSASHNLELGAARAEGVRDFLLAQEVPASLLQLSSPSSRGEQPAADDGEDDGNDNRDWRRTVVYAAPLDEYWIFVKGGASFDPAEVAPSAIGNVDSGPANAYLFLYNPEALALSGNGVTIDTVNFGFSGAAVAGLGSGAAEAYAENLTQAINATDSHRAWREGNVTRVARVGDRFNVQLLATSSRQLSVDDASQFTIVEQFTETRSSVESSNQESNRAIAVGVSVDARFSRQFNMEVTGNSSISARLVSVPAPPEFLDEIREFHAGLDQ